MRFDRDAVASEQAVVGRPSSDTRELEKSGSRATFDHGDYGRGKYEDDLADWMSDEDQGLPITIVYLPKLEGAGTTYIHVHLHDDA